MYNLKRMVYIASSGGQWLGLAWENFCTALQATLRKPFSTLLLSPGPLPDPGPGPSPGPGPGPGPGSLFRVYIQVQVQVK